jgi:polyhydroxyalkanoate synthase
MAEIDRRAKLTVDEPVIGTRTSTDGRAERGVRAAGRSALDVMLTDAAVGQGRSSRFVEPGAAARLGIGLARRPDRIGRRVGGLGVDVARVLAGSSHVAPPKGDRRFTDRGWQESWLFRRLMQTYLVLSDTVDGLIDDAELDWTTERRTRFTVGNMLDAIAPTNFPLTNPSALKETIDRGGANLVKGTRRLIRDIAKGRLPAMVDTTKFDVGGNLAITKGAVVFRSDVFELIHYMPQTAEVYETPLLVVPPTINKYYILDLAPGRSLVEYLVQEGYQVFMISWRNPDEEHGHFDFDTYADAMLEARGAVAEIASQDSVHVMGVCSGGMVAAATAAYLASNGRLAEIASLTLVVCAIDNEQAGTTAALTTREIAAAAVAQSARKGYLEGEALANVFAWLRPNDLIWNYVVNNYLLGKDPPAFDILYWNQDTVRLSAGLHRDFLMLALENALTRPGAFSVLGSGVDLGNVRLDSYILAGSSDHIVPWENAYRTTQLLGGQTRFVLSTSGHIQALINPPSPDSRSSFRTADDHPADVAEWETRAVMRAGSWWPDFVAWLAPRSGRRRGSPKTLGSRRYKAQAKAPGTYVHAS